MIDIKHPHRVFFSINRHRFVDYDGFIDLDTMDIYASIEQRNTEIIFLKLLAENITK